MAKNQLRSPLRSGQAGGQGVWRAVTLIEVGGIISFIAWLCIENIPPFRAENPEQALTLFAFHAALALIVERLLSYHHLSGEATRQRLALLTAAGGPFCALALGLAFPGSGRITLAPLSVGAAGSFSGMLLATVLKEGLWEDNSPPSPQIQAEVLQRHLEVLGPLEKIGVKDRLIFSGLALTGLILSAPIFLISSFLIWLEDPGPILFVKNSTGRGGVNFRQYKFRTMILGAETGTGPIMAEERDPRILKCGRFLRKTALDELPQLINILRGEMSFVGPRPQRTILVHGYLERLPEYAHRHAVLPGISGLAQVAGDYYLTPRQKLRFDRLYIRYAGPGFDLKLLALAFLISFWFRWQKGWNGRLPRRLLHRARKGR